MSLVATLLTAILTVMQPLENYLRLGRRRRWWWLFGEKLDSELYAPLARGKHGRGSVFIGVDQLTNRFPCIEVVVDAGVYTDVDGGVWPYGRGFDLGADENTACWDCDGDQAPDEACGGTACDDTDSDIRPDVPDPCDGLADVRDLPDWREGCFIACLS